MNRKSETKRIKKILVQDVFKVTKEENGYFFEIGEETTSDIAEAVVLLLRKVEWNDPIWGMEIGKNIIYENITPENSLFWLTGGYAEWKELTHYKKPWSEYYLEFQEEFGDMIVNIVRRSKTLSDIRSGFIKHLSLPILYNFAISRNMVR